MSLHAPRLPRAVEADPRHDAVRAALAHGVTPLGGATDIAIPTLHPTAALRDALAAAGAEGRVERGLETIVASLASEARGLRAAGMGSAARVSRLLILSDDGSERFLRQVGRVLQEHGHRLLALRLRCDAAHLGALLFGTGKTAKAACVSHKTAVTSVLLALAEPITEAVPDRSRPRPRARPR